MEIKKVNIEDKFGLIKDYWDPGIIGRLNGQCVKIARLKGEFTWHKHDDEDELFYVIEGELEIALRDQELLIKEGEFVIIPKGVLHKPIAAKEVKVLLFEPETTINTGDINNEFTKTKLKNL